MAETNRGSQDRHRINLQEDSEVAYWTDKLRVTTSKLKAAVVAVGASADDVALHIERCAESDIGRVL